MCDIRVGHHDHHLQDTHINGGGGANLAYRANSHIHIV